MATVVDKSGNKPDNAPTTDEHVETKQEIIIAKLEQIETNTAPA